MNTKERRFIFLAAGHTEESVMVFPASLKQKKQKKNMFMNSD